MLEAVKLALRRSTDDFDSEIQLLIDDCLLELSDLGIKKVDAQVKTAVIAYCKWKFGDNDSAERWEKIYKDKVSRLMCTTGYGLSAGE